MFVHFMRHGIAAPRGAPGVVDDASRELTRDGIVRMRRQAKGLVRMGLKLDQIWTSPLTRSRQTAEIVAEAFKLAGPPRVLEALAPGGSFEAIIEALASHSKLREVALVGHEPDLSEDVSRLLAGMPGPFLELRKGGAACVEIDGFAPPVRGGLCWLLTPKQLRRMA
jgi:phosphohistidine phosphatase